jgi:hypothetical protein
MYSKKLHTVNYLAFYVKRSDPDPNLFFQIKIRFGQKGSGSDQIQIHDTVERMPAFFREMEGSIPPVPENDIVKSER